MTEEERLNAIVRMVEEESLRDREVEEMLKWFYDLHGMLQSRYPEVHLGQVIEVVTLHLEALGESFDTATEEQSLRILAEWPKYYEERVRDAG